MPRIRIAGYGTPRRGATRRRRAHRNDYWAAFDHWLDRIVVVAVITGLVVGGAALMLTLLR